MKFDDDVLSRLYELWEPQLVELVKSIPDALNTSGAVTRELLEQSETMRDQLCNNIPLSREQMIYLLEQVNKLVIENIDLRAGRTALINESFRATLAIDRLTSGSMNFAGRVGVPKQNLLVQTSPIDLARGG